MRRLQNALGGYLNMLNMKTFLVTVANVEYYVSTVDLV